MSKVQKILGLISLIVLFGLSLVQSAEVLKLVDKGDQIWVYSTQMRFQINKYPFYLEIYQNTTENLRFSSKDIPIKLAQWDGVSFQSKIYEGYSFRFGKIVYEVSSVQMRGYQLSHQQREVNFYITTNSNEIIKFDITNVDEVRLTLNVSIQGNNSKLNRVIWGFNSDESEGLYGFGERFVPQQNRKNQSFYDWVEDGGWGFGYNTRLPKGIYSTYMPMPVALSSKGYAFWVNTTYRTDWKISQTQCILTSETKNLNLNLLYGGYPQDSLTEMIVEFAPTRLIPPKFSFGLWEQFENEQQNISTAEFPYDKGVAVWRRFIQMDIPCSVQKQELHFSPRGSQRGNEQYWSDVNSVYAQDGIAPTAYFNPMIATDYTELYDKALEQNLFVRRSSGEVAVFLYKGAGKVPFKVSMLDFTNPAITDFWAGMLNKSLELGYRGWMQDYGEYVDPYQKFYNGQTGEQVHNDYVNIYHQASYDYFQSFNQEDFKNGLAPNYIYYVRSAYTGSQGNVWSSWTGDPCGDFTKFCGLPAQISAMLSVGIVGMSYIGSDIGGFTWINPPSKELWIRWLQLGAVSPIMAIQGGGTSMAGQPKSHLFQWGDGVASLRYLSKFRTQIFPYLYTQAYTSASIGAPIMRHHVLSFPLDEEALKQNYQYMFGDSLLCAPSIQANAVDIDVYLPQNNQWFDLTNNVQFSENDGRFAISWSTYHAGGTYQTILAPLVAALPVILVRSGSILALQDPTIDVFLNTTNPLVVSQFQKKDIIHYWVFPQNKTGTAFGKTYDGSNSQTVYSQQGNLSSTLQWSNLDELNRVYTAQILLPTLDITSKSLSFNITVPQNQTIQQTDNFEEIVQYERGNFDSWKYLYNQTTKIIWLRYTGCSNPASRCRSEANITFTS